MFYNSVYIYVYENNSMLPDRILYNCTIIVQCTPRPMGVFVCCDFCLDAQVFHTAGARVCLFPTKGNKYKNIFWVTDVNRVRYHISKIEHMLDVSGPLSASLSLSYSLSLSLYLCPLMIL